jgi:hypothetical protein
VAFYRCFLFVRQNTVIREDLRPSAPIRRVGSNQTHSFARLRQVETVIGGVRITFHYGAFT